jgi:hypothetical protein
MKKLIFPLMLALAGLSCKHVHAASAAIAIRQDDTAGYHKFRMEADKQIKENEQKIAELKAKKKEGTKEVAEKYNKKVAELEEKNKEMRNRINNYNADKKGQKWDAFKHEFNRDMKELGQALRDLGKDNVK